MKVQFRSALFVLVIAACGGGDEPKSVSVAPWDYLPKTQAADSQPIVDTKVVVETKAPIVEIPATPSKLDEVLELAKKEPKKAEHQIELARIYISMNERGKAISAANKAIKLAPNSSQAWNTKGRAELTAHNYENAIEAFTKSVDLNADNAFAWNNLGYTELLLKRYEDAAEHLTEATTKKDATGYMFNNLGTALEHLDRLDDARMAYEAGGKLGSGVAAASRKRLEGVDSIAVVASSEPSPSPEVKTYDVNDEVPEPEGNTVEEPEVEAEPDDNATH